MTRRSAQLWVFSAFALVVSCKPNHQNPGEAGAPLSEISIKGDTGSGTKTPPAVFRVDDGYRLTAYLAGASTVALDLKQHVPKERFSGRDSFALFEQLSIAAQGDFDEEGTPDAVVGLYLGGNACPGPSYVVVTAAPLGIKISPEFASCTAGDLKVERRNDHFEISVHEGNAFRVFALNHAEIVELRPQTVVERLSAVAELRYDDLVKKNAPKSIRRDLDGDGRADTISCEPLRNLLCKVTNADGTDMGSDIIASGRLGVLKSRTLGHCDLVVGDQMLLRWNGKRYD